VNGVLGTERPTLSVDTPGRVACPRQPFASYAETLMPAGTTALRVGAPCLTHRNIKHGKRHFFGPSGFFNRFIYYFPIVFYEKQLQNYEDDDNIMDRHPGNASDQIIIPYIY
jgi:hypothetical protein